MREVIIDPEFRDLLPALTQEEYEALEKQIVEQGQRDAIILWNNIIVDGHNRYDILTKYDKTPKCMDMEFSCREEAMSWMIDNQRGRRNSTPAQIDYLIGKQYQFDKKVQGTNNQYVQAKSEKGQNDLFHNTKKAANETAIEIGKKYGVGEATVRRNERFARAADKV